MPINWTDQLKPLGTDHDYWRLIRGRDVDITEAHSALTTLEDADIFLVDEAAAGNLTSTKKIASSDMKTYFQSGVLPLTGGTMTGTLVLDNTGVTAAPSAAGKFLAVAAASYVDNDTSSGETAAQNFYGTRFSLHAIRPSSGSITTTDAATVYIEGATTAGTGQTITNNYALQLGAGDVKLPDDGKILFGNANEYIKGDGTDLIISSTGHIDFNSTRVHSIGRLTLDISGSAVDIIRDEDDMASDDDQALATQQSIKAYVDNGRRWNVHNSDLSWRMGTVNNHYIGSQSLGTSMSAADFGYGEIKYAMYNAVSACTLVRMQWCGYVSSTEPYEFNIVTTTFSDDGSSASSYTNIATIDVNSGSDATAYRLYRVAWSGSKALARDDQVYLTCKYKDGSGTKYVYGSATFEFKD